MQVFFSDDDYQAYRAILAHQARRHELQVWAYCLMPNHVHLVGTPATADGLSLPIGEAHRRFALQINRRERWTGHLWQERFSSFPMDETHLLAAVRYVLLNPLRAGLVDRVEDWPYSSAGAHLGHNTDPLVFVRPMASRIENWGEFLDSSESEGTLQDIRQHSSTGRPLGSTSFVRRLEGTLGRRLRPQRPGPKAQDQG
jgi:putative transposase